MIRRTATRLVLAAVLMSCGTACARVSTESDGERFPEFTNHVVDAAGVVPDDAETTTNAELSAYQEATGVQIAVAAIETTGDQSIEDYTIDLAKHWGIGSADEDNGVLLLFAVKDRRLRIEVGEGVEGEMTDLESGRVRDAITPLLRDGEYGKAISVGTLGIRRAIGGDDAALVEQPPPEESDNDRRVPGGGLWGLVPFLFIPFFFGARRRRAPVYWGGGTVQRSRARSRANREGDDEESRGDNWLAAAILGGLLLGGGRRGGWSSGGGIGGGGFGGGGGGDFGGGGASGDW